MALAAGLVCRAQPQPLGPLKTIACEIFEWHSVLQRLLRNEHGGTH